VGPTHLCEHSQESLDALNRSVELHLGLLSDDAMLTKFRFVGLGTLQQILLY